MKWKPLNDKTPRREKILMYDAMNDKIIFDTLMHLGSAKTKWWDITHYINPKKPNESK